jgi:hypothetical protein
VRRRRTDVLARRPPLTLLADRAWHLAPRQPRGHTSRARAGHSDRTPGRPECPDARTEFEARRDPPSFAFRGNASSGGPARLTWVAIRFRTSELSGPRVEAEPHAFDEPARGPARPTWVAIAFLLSPLPGHALVPAPPLTPLAIGHGTLRPGSLEGLRVALEQPTPPGRPDRVEARRDLRPSLPRKRVHESATDAGSRTDVLAPPLTPLANRASRTLRPGASRPYESRSSMPLRPDRAGRPRG